MSNPNQFPDDEAALSRKPRRILVCVTGLSPQIVTETLYALCVKGADSWIPDEVHLVTTRRGAENARLTLLSDKPGWFHRFLLDWNLKGLTSSPA